MADPDAVDALLLSVGDEAAALSRLSPLLGACWRTCSRLPGDVRYVVAEELATVSRHIAGAWRWCCGDAVCVDDLVERAMPE